MAERMGFEPMVPRRHNCLAGSPIQPLSHLSTCRFNNGGGSRIRTHGASRHNGFQDRRFRPLSHPTKIATLFYQRHKVCVKKISASETSWRQRSRSVESPTGRASSLLSFGVKTETSFDVLFNWQVQGFVGIIPFGVRIEPEFHYGCVLAIVLLV